MWFASLWSETGAPSQLVVLGALGHAWAIGLVGFAVRDLAAISRVDYAAPVLEIQRRIAELRARRVRVAPFYVVTGAFMWIPIAIVFLRRFGAELWPNETALAGWFAWAKRPEIVAWLLANCIVVPVLLLLVLRWLRDPGRAGLAKRVDDELAGRSVRRAESMLAGIAAFERS